MRREKGRPRPDAPPAAYPGTRMLTLPEDAADPMRLAEEAIEELRRKHPPRPVKINKKKPKRSGAIGAPRGVAVHAPTPGSGGGAGRPGRAGSFTVGEALGDERPAEGSTETAEA